MTSNHDDLSTRLRHGLGRTPAPDLSPELVTGAGDRPAPRLTNPARAMRVVGGAGFAVAALAVAAVVVVPSLTPRAPLFTAAASAPAGALGTEDAISSQLKIGWWVDYNYFADPSLSTEGGSGQVYRLAVGTDDPEGFAAELAETLGVTGAPAEAEWSDDKYPTWIVGPQDGSAPNLSFSAYGTGDWWYNDPAAVPVYVCDASVTVEQAPEFGCVLPSEAPANLAPVGEEAQALAADLFASTGYEVDAADIEIYSDEWSTSATAYLVVDGERTALAWSANWSNTGALSYAYGHTVSVESQGSFETVSPTEAVTRLEDGRWYGSPGPDFQGGAIAFATDLLREGDASASEPAEPEAEPTDAPVDPSTPAEPAPSEEPVDPETPVTPAPEETPITEPLPEPTPEVIDVTIDNATATLMLLWDVDGNAWLVPGYAMQMDEGWWNAVVSLVEGVIALPEPFVLEPAVIDPELVDVGVTK